MGESWPRPPVQTERSEVCTSDRGQDSPIQTDIARLIRCLLYGQTRNAQAQAFNWLSSVTGLQSKRDKNNCSKSSFVQTSSMSEGKFFIQAQWESLWLKQQFMKTLMLNVQPSNLSMCAPAKIAWGWICWTVKAFCCVVVEVPTCMASDWADVPGSQLRIADISRFRFRDAEW